MSTCGCSQPVSPDPCPTQFSQPPEQGGFSTPCDNPFIRMSLQGLRAELPYEADGVDPLHEVCPLSGLYSVTLPGDGAVAYTLLFRIRGACEFNQYIGGLWLGGPVNEGGTSDGSNQFDLEIPALGLVLHINGNEFGGPPDLLRFDYQFPVLGVPSNAVVNIRATSPGVQLSNRFFAIAPPPGVPPSPDWFDGQFLQIDCESAIQEP